MKRYETPAISITGFKQDEVIMSIAISGTTIQKTPEGTLNFNS